MGAEFPVSWRARSAVDSVSLSGEVKARERRDVRLGLQYVNSLAVNFIVSLVQKSLCFSRSRMMGAHRDRLAVVSWVYASQ